MRHRIPQWRPQRSRKDRLRLAHIGAAWRRRYARGNCRARSARGAPTARATRDARAHVDRLAYEVAANRNTIAGLATKAEAERLAHGDTHRLLADASAEVERARAAATEAIRARMDAVDAMRVAAASANEVRDESLRALAEACELLRGAAPPSGCVDHGPDGVGC